MNIMQQVSEEIKQILDEKWLSQLAKETGFIKRERKIKAKLFLERLLINQLQMPRMSLEELAAEVVEEGCVLRKQSLHQKFTYSGKEFLRNVLEKSLEKNFSKVDSIRGLDFIR